MMQPKSVSTIDTLNGRSEGLLPAIEEIPQEYFNPNNKWNEIASTWLHEGILDAEMPSKEGIKAIEAVMHVTALLKSSEPEIEHKIAGCAYLLSQFFEDINIIKTGQLKMVHR